MYLLHSAVDPWVGRHNDNLSHLPVCNDDHPGIRMEWAYIDSHKDALPCVLLPQSLGWTLTITCTITATMKMYNNSYNDNNNELETTITITVHQNNIQSQITITITINETYNNNDNA